MKPYNTCVVLMARQQAKSVAAVKQDIRFRSQGWGSSVHAFQRLTIGNCILFSYRVSYKSVFQNIDSAPN
jgi:hypothetical protein